MHESESLKGRFWEVDLTRGLAVIMMIVFHFVYDLDYFGIRSSNISTGFWFYFARATAGLFILLVGISLVLSTSRAEMQGKRGQIFAGLLKRGLWIFFLGAIVTLATYILVGDGFIVFGILHFIGISIILAYPFLSLRPRAMNLVFGAAAIAIGLFLQARSYPTPWLLWLGLAPEGFYTLDYVPIFPWFGVVLIGIFLGGVLYGGYRRNFPLPDISGSFSARLLCIMGQNSLIIYLVHQPLIVATLVLLGYASYPG